MAVQYPDIMIRVSIEGLLELNDRLRGLEDNFDHALRTMLRLRALGIEDIGFAMTISGDNCRDLPDVYELVAAMVLGSAEARAGGAARCHAGPARREGQGREGVGQELQAGLLDDGNRRARYARETLEAGGLGAQEQDLACSRQAARR